MHSKYLKNIKNYYKHSSLRDRLHIVRNIKHCANSLKYGVKDSFTYNMDYAMSEYLYCALRRYKDLASELVVLDDPQITFEYEGKQYTQLEMIDMILDKLSVFLSDDFDYDSIEINYEDPVKSDFSKLTIYEEKQNKALHDAWKMWEKIIDACWW